MMSGIKQPLFFGEVFYYCTELKTFCFHFCYTGNFKKSLGIGSIKNIQCYIIYVYTYDIYIYMLYIFYKSYGGFSSQFTFFPLRTWES